MPAPDFLSMLDALRPAARAAGAAQMRLWRKNIHATRKRDGTPVSEADQAAHDIMEAALAALAPTLPLVSEEGWLPEATPAERYWLLDPLDGTKAFLRGEPDFVICLALIERGRAVAGLMHAPAHDLLAFGALGQGAWHETKEGPRPVPIRRLSAEGLGREGIDLLVPSRHPTPSTDAYLRGLSIRRRALPSAMKFLRILLGEADATMRFERIQQWDIAAADALIRAAGGDFRCPDGTALQYGASPDLGWQSATFVATAIGGFEALETLRAAEAAHA